MVLTSWDFKGSYTLLDRSTLYKFSKSSPTLVLHFTDDISQHLNCARIFMTFVFCRLVGSRDWLAAMFVPGHNAGPDPRLLPYISAPQLPLVPQPSARGRSPTFRILAPSEVVRQISVESHGNLSVSGRSLSPGNPGVVLVSQPASPRSPLAVTYTVLKQMLDLYIVNS